MRALSRILAVLLIAAPALAQAQNSAITSTPIVSLHDYDSSSATYCVLSALKTQPVRVKTSGSSATLTAASGTPFSPSANQLKIAPGDEIVVNFGTAPFTKTTRYVQAVASTTSLTMNAAADFSGNGATGYAIEYRTLSCGTGLGDGWFNVSSYVSKLIAIQLDQLTVASGSVDVVVDCKGTSPWAQPIRVYPPTGGSGQCGTGLFTTAGITARCGILLGAAENWGSCRVGVTLTDDAGDLTTDIEQVTVTFEGR